MYLSNNYDVDSQIILDLPFNDLINFCATNKYTNDFYHCNKLLYFKFDTINKTICYNINYLLDHITYYSINQFNLNSITSNKLYIFTTIINKYNIRYTDIVIYNYYYMKNLVVKNITLNADYFINFHMIYPSCGNYPFVETCKISKKQLISFLFHLYYDKYLQL
jgi:hypothetical protein